MALTLNIRTVKTLVKIKISDRAAELISTKVIPSGNHNTILLSIDSIAGDIWNDTAKSAVFFVVTKRGEIKVAETVLDSNLQCFIPGKILAEQSAQLSVSIKGTKTDGSVVASNRCIIGNISPGAGYDLNAQIEELSKSEFESIMRAIASMSVPNADTLKLFTVDSEKNLYFNGQRIASVPKGGTKGQVLTKASDSPYDYDWKNSATFTYNTGVLTIE